MLKSLFALLFTFSLFFAVNGDSVILADGGKTNYVIVAGKIADPIQKLAAEELVFHLEKMTGARFNVAENGSGKQCRIYLGLSDEARKVLGKDDLSSVLKPQENVIQVKGNDLFLYGNGKHGTLFAVYELLETHFGCRWLTVYEEPFIPQKTKLTLKKGSYRTAYAFPLRSLMNYFYKDKYKALLYDYRNRQNLLIGLDHRDRGIVPEIEIYGPACHTLSVIMPGFTVRGANKPAEWHTVKDYFKIHPEWFSLDEHGKRVSNRQLCFSNREMRKEYIKNALEMHRRQTAKYGKSYLTLDLNDIAYRICCCKDCLKLEEKYQCRGGAFFDLLLEFCKKHKEIEFVTLAYQRSLTQTPPVTEEFPENLTVIFCPINGIYSGTMDRENKRDMDDLQGWLKLTRKVWVWYYPNPYCYNSLAVHMPLANFERIAKDIRLMHKAGVQGTYFEHDSGGITLSANLTEMQSWVMFKLFQNPSLDEKALMKDFAEHYYGKAAPIILKYAQELESELNAFVKKGGKWQYNTWNYHYLIPENLKRWNQMFEEAGKLVSGKEEFHVRLARMGLDCAIIEKLGVDPQYKTLVAASRERLLKTYKESVEKRPTTVTMKRLETWLKEVDQRGMVKALPEEFRKLPADSVIVVVPKNNARSVVKDPTAHLGVAQSENWNGKKYTIGTYDYATKKYGPGRDIFPFQMKKGEYALYKIEKPFALTQGLIMWGGSWSISLPLRDLIRNDDPEMLKQKWTLYVSLKFTEDKVYLDRGILVKEK